MEKLSGPGKPHRRIKSELLNQEDGEIQSWRVFRILAEFVDGFQLLSRFGLAATFFGTSRCQFGDRVYEGATELAKRLSSAGFTIMTGGGAGVMEAANKGAHEAGGASVGLNIRLDHEQELNKYVNESQDFHFFFTRKVMLAFASEVYIFFPGGFGTLDEFFEMATLVQTKKIKQIPIVLVDREYWRPLLSWIEKDLYGKYAAIDKEDMEIYHLVDSVDEAFDAIMKLTVKERETEKSS